MMYQDRIRLRDNNGFAQKRLAGVVFHNRAQRMDDSRRVDMHSSIFSCVRYTRSCSGILLLRLLALLEFFILCVKIRDDIEYLAGIDGFEIKSFRVDRMNKIPSTETTVFCSVLDTFRWCPT